MSGRTERTALVLGATGGVGGEVADALLRRGWRVRALHRDPQAAAMRWRSAAGQPEWVAGDAMDGASVQAATPDGGVIVHAVNPPGYRNWNKLVLPMLGNTVAAAERSGARIMLPGTVYNYGPDAGPILTEDSPQSPVSRKGAIRVAMERQLRAASDRGVRVLIVRAGDFFGPRSGNNWFAQGLVTPGRRLTKIQYPGRRGVGHQWAYLPDVAETTAQLLERGDERPLFEAFHMAGHWDADGTAMIAAIRRATGGAIAVRPFPWWLVRVASPVVPLFQELAEMRYLWNTAVRMSNAHLVSVIGDEPHTPLEEAVRRTLLGIGCLSAG